MPTQVQTKVDVGSTLDFDTNLKTPPTVAQKTASPAKTASKTSSVSLPGDEQSMRHMMDLAANLDKIDVSDEPDVDGTFGSGEVTPDTIPAVINKEIRAHGQVEPEWHMVKNLPGYLSKPIRKMGRQIFDQFTDTPIEQINILANLGGQGPNENREINAVAGIVSKLGTQLHDAELRMEDLIPGYQADIKVYEYQGVVFMLVQDFAGNYIYSWPTETSHYLS